MDLHTSGPLSVEERYAQFIAAYEVRDFDRASRAFIEALSDTPGKAFRHFFVNAGGQLAESCIEAYRTGDLVPVLSRMQIKYPGINIICDDIPGLAQEIAEHRERLIDKGLPSIVLVSQGKSGSMTVGNIFNSGFSLPTVAYSFCHWKIVDSWAADYARGGACHWTHLEPDREQIRRLRAAGIHKAIVHVRDPRQALVSVVHHLEKYPDQLVRLRGDAKQGGSVSEKARLVLPYYKKTIKWIENWVSMESEIGIMFSTFEKMVSNWDRFVDSYVDFYGGYTKHFSKENASTQHAGLDYHIRKGQPDEWREVFTAQEAAELSAMLPDRLKDRFGWPE